MKFHTLGLRSFVEARRRAYQLPIDLALSNTDLVDAIVSAVKRVAG